MEIFAQEIVKSLYLLNFLIFIIGFVIFLAILNK